MELASTSSEGVDVAASLDTLGDGWRSSHPTQSSATLQSGDVVLSVPGASHTTHRDALIGSLSSATTSDEEAQAELKNNPSSMLFGTPMGTF